MGKVSILHFLLISLVSVVIAEFCCLPLYFLLPCVILVDIQGEILLSHNYVVGRGKILEGYLIFIGACMCVSRSVRLGLFVIPWTAARQASWNSRLPWNSPGKDTGGDCHSSLQRNFPTQGLNPGLLHHRQMSLPFEL